MFDQRIHVYASAAVATIVAAGIVLALRPPPNIDPLYAAGSYFAVALFALMIAQAVFLAVAALLGRGGA